MTLAGVKLAEALKNGITELFNGNALMATFVIALLPIFELRGAIPFGMSYQIWGQHALSATNAFLTSFFATTLIIPIVALIFIPILKLLKKSKIFNSFANYIFNHFKSKSSAVQGNSKFYKMLGVFVFVAVPLPLTGVYTGTVIAVIIGLNFYETLISCTLGNLVAGLIITFLSSALKQYSIYVLFAFISLLILVVLYKLLNNFLNYKSLKK